MQQDPLCGFYKLCYYIEVHWSIGISIGMYISYTCMDVWCLIFIYDTFYVSRNTSEFFFSKKNVIDLRITGWLNVSFH